jgi:NTE family protein
MPELIKQIISIQLLFICLFTTNLSAQKVGLVLSGGGAGGLAHIGVLKALEEKQISLDFITGTSVGALIGGLYASGYSPDQIKEFVLDEKFQRYTKGELEEKYKFHYKRSTESASWFTYNFGIDSVLSTNIPTNIINSIPIDFYLMELFTAASTQSNYNFDSLFIPFRCVASDIENKKVVVFKDGNLHAAVRASMTYPFYLKPITINGKLLFDGGLYNNFPVDVMKESFHPDFIIGSVVTDNNPIPNDENLYVQLRNMLMTKTDFGNNIENGIIIKPWSDIGVFSFNEANRLIDSGYSATIKAVENLSPSFVSKNNKIKSRRETFNTKLLPAIFDSISISGVNIKQQQYLKKSIFSNEKIVSIDKLRKRYLLLTDDDKIKSLFPSAIFNPKTEKHTLEVIAKKEKNFKLELGGNFSNRPISAAFIGLQFNHLGKRAITVYSNAYFGKLNTSLLGKIKIDFPSKIPFYVEAIGLYSKWDYFRSSTLFYNVLRPAFLIQEDAFTELSTGIPFGNRAKISLGGGIANMGNIYYQNYNFSDKDTADRTDFTFNYSRAEYELNTLNRKKYASEVLYISARLKYFNGFEYYKPGTTSFDTSKSIIFHDWLQFNAKIDYYLKTSNFLKIGILGEAVYSDQDFFRNYTSTILSSPAFMPTPESKTLFLEKFRAHKFIAGGAKLIINPFKNLDIRLEGYIFQPIQSIVKNNTNKPEYSINFLYRYLTGMAAVVYHTPIGPISTSVNYYLGEKNPVSFLFHFGYTIFNKKAID